MDGEISYMFNIIIREFNDEEKDACKDKEEVAWVEEEGRGSENQYAQPEANNPEMIKHYGDCPWNNIILKFHNKKNYYMTNIIYARGDMIW